MTSRHNPESNEYGDCLRTVIACLLEIEPQHVPHFVFDGADGATVWRRCNAFLAMHGLATLRVPFPGEYKIDDLLLHMKLINPGIYYILGHFNGNADHVVIGLDDHIVHDPGFGGIHLDLMQPASDSNLWDVYYLISEKMVA